MACLPTPSFCGTSIKAKIKKRARLFPAKEGQTGALFIERMVVLIAKSNFGGLATFRGFDRLVSHDLSFTQ